MNRLSIIPEDFNNWTDYILYIIVKSEQIIDCFKKYNYFESTLAYLEFSKRIIINNNIDLENSIILIKNKLINQRLICLDELNNE